ncbi:MAG: histidine phosphatase family protein [Spirochaetales bacterium]|nr:histidine phosphatase family protein [Spirochaetales bacterium]
MSQIFLVRHGQANAGGDDYDLLSPLGKKQAMQLGTWAAQNQLEIRTVVTGGLRRQKESAQFFLEGLGSGSGPHPAIREDRGWDEFSPEIWKAIATELAQRDAAFARDLVRFQKERHRAGMRRATLFYRLTALILQSWQEGLIPVADGQALESYAAFEARVAEARLQAFGRVGGIQFVFSSGTPIALCLHHFLAQKTNALGWLYWLWNTSVSQFQRLQGGYQVVAVNTLPHLTGLKERTLW